MIQPLRGIESPILFIGRGEAPGRILAWGRITAYEITGSIVARSRREASTSEELTPGSRLGLVMT